MLCLLQLSCSDFTSAQTITPKGTDHTLDVATWNIEWFGDSDPGHGPTDDERQFNHVKSIIEQADLDLWAVQEIADSDDFDRLLAELSPHYEGVLATEDGEPKSYGFIYKTGTISLRGNPKLILNQEDFLYDFAWRPPLQIEVDVVLPDSTVTISFITMHMKAYGDQQSYNRRVAASGRLKNYIDYSALHNKPVIVLGDFNDELVGSTYAGNLSPYDNFLQDTDDYFFPSLAVEQAGISTYIGFTPGSNLDHILITNELIPAYIGASADCYTELTQAFPGFAYNTSDHLPIFARFQYARNTAVDPDELPVSSGQLSVYPNPVRAHTIISYTLDRPAPVSIRIFDLLGRLVATPVKTYQHAGNHVTHLDAHTLPSGRYLVYLQAADNRSVYPIVRLP